MRMAGGRYGDLAARLGVEERALLELDHRMAAATGKRAVLENLHTGNALLMEAALEKLRVQVPDFEIVERALHNQIRMGERELKAIVEGGEGETIFDQAAELARRIARPSAGFFLKRERIAEVLSKYEPKNLLSYLGYKSAPELLAHEDPTEAMSALRFVESTEWMHELFERAYTGLTVADFEERAVEVRVLGARWRGIAEQFVQKKHHNVSHLKEFGVIFLNPIAEGTPGKFVRDFALILHYFHEIAFYAKLFRRYATAADFTARFTSLLRGDVREAPRGETGDAVAWMIIQRYLAKEHPEDPRLFVPHVNPESLHWRLAERDLVAFGKEHPETGLALWDNLDWVGGSFRARGGEQKPISFDLEDNAMSLVAEEKGREQFLYHGSEALWTELCMGYAGGEQALETLLIERFDAGMLRFARS